MADFNETKFDLSDSECPYDEEYMTAEAADGFDERQIRAACEDDDGYDPYSDRIETEPLFERDPWN
ncbi:MAG: hypothetical protein E7003_00115 [Eggerthellaceae bacterium]|nr:hypothetical protein [Eggerthellaceae bacterium]